MQQLRRTKPYKQASPMETIRRIRNILFEHDIFVIEVSQQKDPITGICSCRVILGDQGLRELNIGSNGKGMDARYALASAYAEFMERLENGAILWKVLGVPKSIPGAVAVSDTAYMSLVTQLMTFAYGPSEESAKKAATWASRAENTDVVIFREYRTREALMIPAALLNKMTGSNGMASGNTYLEAIIQGLGEIFERFAVQKLFLEQVTAPMVPNEMFEGTEVHQHLERMQEIGLSCKILDCSLGIGLPVLGLMIERSGLYHVQFGADPSPITALERCLTETLQGRSFDTLPLLPLLPESSNHDARFENERKEYTDSSGRVPAWLTADEPSWQFEGFAHPSTNSDEEDMSYYLEVLDRLEKKLYVMKMGDLGFPSVRLYVPGITENHCPSSDYCFERSLPGETGDLMKRIPLLTDEEFCKLASLINIWLSSERFDEGVKKLKEALPVGFFPGREWDDGVLVAALYVRGGFDNEGYALLDDYIQRRKVPAAEAVALKARIRSKSLMFLKTEWPQCPGCKSCQAKSYCLEDKISEWKQKLLVENGVAR